MTALISLSLSFVSLSTIGSLVLRVDTDDGSGFMMSDSELEAYDPNDAEQSTSILDYFTLKFMVSVICAFGMIVASLLNGFGCASLPHSNLVGIYLKPTPFPVIKKVEDDYHYAVKQLEEKRWMLQDEIKKQSTESTRRSGRWFITSKHTISPEQERVQQLQEEVIYFENLVGDMKDDIEEMKQSHQLALFARTPFGRVRGVLGVIFSVVLVVRVILAANSFMPRMGSGGNSFNTSGSRDPLTSIFAWLLGRKIVTAEQYDLFRQGTSLVLAGALSMSQVRAFFRVVGALGRRMSRAYGTPLHVACISTTPREAAQSMGHGNNVALLLSSFVMGCYFLACVAVVKMTLPIEYRSSFSTAVGLNFTFNTKLLNEFFFVSSCVSAITLASLFGIQRNNSERYQLESKLSLASKKDDDGNLPTV